MPNPPNTEGLPAWAAVAITALFGLSTLGVMMRGYFSQGPKSEQPQIAQLLGASIADMGAVRHLSDVCIQLSGWIERLEYTNSEQMHHLRRQNELLEENCQRLRELRETLDRQGLGRLQ